MKRRKMLLSVLLAFLFLFAFTACGQGEAGGDETGGGESSGEQTPGGDSGEEGGEDVGPGGDTEQKVYSALYDPTFENGFTVSAYASNLAQVYLGEIHYDQTEAQYDAAGGAQPSWVMAQWGCENNIAPSAIAAKGQDGYWQYKTDTLQFDVNTETGALRMGVDAGEEYESPRVDGQEWPHLLIEQGNLASHTPYLSEMDSLVLTIDYTLEKSENLMGDSYNSGLHAAQFQWYVTVQNMNPASPDYGDMIWFGLQMYDNRHEYTPSSLAVDGGKDDASGKAIYVVGATLYLPDATKVGVKNGFSYDILPQLQIALRKSQNFDGVEVFQNTSFSDLKITSMNLGWELPGTFDAAVSVEKVGIDYTVKQK